MTAVKIRKQRRDASIESKIKTAQEKAERSKARYEKALARLQDLIKLRERKRQKELMNAIEKSEHTFEEIMQFIKG